MKKHTFKVKYNGKVIKTYTLKNIKHYRYRKEVEPIFCKDSLKENYMVFRDINLYE